MTQQRDDAVKIRYSGDYELVGESGHRKSEGWSVVYRGGGQARMDYQGGRQECDEWLDDRGHTVRQHIAAC